MPEIFSRASAYAKHPDDPAFFFDPVDMTPKINSPAFVRALDDMIAAVPWAPADQTNAGHLVSALVKLYKDNASTLTPDPLYSAFYYSHPPAAQRIDRLLAHA